MDSFQSYVNFSLYQIKVWGLCIYSYNLIQAMIEPTLANFMYDFFIFFIGSYKIPKPGCVTLLSVGLLNFPQNY